MVFEKLREIICSEFSVEEYEVVPEADFAMDLGMDSLDLVDLQMSIEDVLEFEFPFDEEKIEEQLKKIKTVDDLVKYIESNK